MDKTKIIIFAVIGIIVVVTGAVILANPFKEAAPPLVTLEFWSVFDDSQIYQPLIQQYQKLYPNVTINYYKKNIASYENDLVDALATGRGPDIFSIHNSWLPKHKDKLAPASEDPGDVKKYSSLFVDAAARDFVDDNKIYAFPLSVDSLALFYNKDLLNSAGISSPPKTWPEFNSAVETLTKRDDKNNILQVGAALGTARNVNRSTDILAALMLQSGAKMTADDKRSATFDQSFLSGSETFNPGKQALIFYTNFAIPSLKVYTWNSLQHYSIDAFVEGNAAMMLNYAYQAPVIAARAPHLNFGVAPLPQISQNSKKVTLGNYWAQTVGKGSKNITAAWQFVTWLSSQESSRAYLKTAKKPAARRDLIEEQKSDVGLGVFAEQALYASSWWEIDNLAIERIFADMIESVVAGKAAADDALTQANSQTTLLMREAFDKQQKQ
ncbi:MAG: extracellular solute-binding protein [Candidatus Portnoybacteria bacterium]|nr:extracellular solute-binding protein [Candidatus Portnoybacteria bacterium]MDD4982818.1 extracellular solute-binding protein [Candidatus Portnoybacteria bacterium]